MSATVDISFLITNYNMGPLIEECIGLVEKQMEGMGLTCEILVGDTSTEEEFALSAERCARWPTGRFRKIAGRSNWVAALNDLIPLSVGRVVCIMHPDIDFDAGCVRACVRYMDEHAEIGVVAPNPYWSYGDAVWVPLHFPTVGTQWRRFVNLLLYLVIRRRPLQEFRTWDHRGDVQVDSVLSMCYFCRGDLLRSFGAIGGGLENYYANDYICMKTQRAGKRVAYLAGPRIVHFERRTPRAMFGASEAMRYKVSSILGGPSVHRDRLRFVRCLHSWPAAFAIRLITVFEFSIHTAVAWVKGRGRVTDNCRAYWECCKVALRDFCA